MSATSRQALALAAVLSCKLLIVLQLLWHPLLQPDAGLDTSASVDLARQVAAGNVSLGPGLYYLSPLYVYWLALGLGLSDSFAIVRLGQAVLGTVGVAGVFVASRAWFGDRAAWLAAGLAALTGLLTFYESILLQAALDPVLTAAALAAAALGLSRNQPRWTLVAGVLFGLASLNRPNMAIAAAAMVLASAVARRGRVALLLAAGVLAGLAPVAIRNAVVSHQLALVSSHGGLNFLIGNGDGATGFYRPVSGITPDIRGQARDARRVAEAAAGHALTDSEVSDYFFAAGLAWMRQHPGAAASLLARKLGYTLSAHHVALPHSYPFFAYDAGTLLPALFVGPWLLVPLGLVGLGAAMPAGRRPEYLIWVTFVPGYAAAVALFFVAERYRLPLLVPLACGAGAALDAAWRAVEQRRLRALVAPAAALAALAVLVNWPLGLHDGRWEERVRMAQRLVIEGRYDEAEAWTRRGAELAPRPGATEAAVGLQLLGSGQPQRAIDLLQRAAGADPGNPALAYSVGRAMVQAGRAADAVPYLRRGFEAGIDLPAGGIDLPAALLEGGDAAAALAALRRVRPAADDPDTWLRAGRVAAQAGAVDLAEGFFRRAVAIAPALASAHQQLGLNLLVQRRHADAAAALAEAVRLDPRNPDSLSRLAYCELELGQPDAARTHAAAALSLNPRDELARRLVEALDR